MARRRIRTLLFGLLAAPVLLELALQLGAVVAALANRPPAPRAREGTAILCVGDSWTFGVGAESPDLSYPSQLERLLAGRYGEGTWQVVNCGWPGQNSREVLAKLPAQIDEHRPALVCILVGANDFWTQPSPLEETGMAEGAKQGFRLRWRTRRLATLLVDTVRERSRSTRDEAAASGETWELEPPPPEPPSPYPYVAAATEQATAGRAAFRRGEFAVAIDAFERGLALNPEEPTLTLGLVRAHKMFGRTEDADRYLRSLRERHSVDREYGLTKAFLWALLATGLDPERAAVARQMVEDHPDAFWPRMMYAHAAAAVGDAEAAMAAIDRSVAIAPTALAHTWRAMIYGQEGHKVEATLSLMRAYLLDRDEASMLHSLRARWYVYSPATYEEALARIECTPAQRRALERIGATAFDTRRTEVSRVLRGHLERMAEICESRAAKPVLMSYAIKMPTPSENLVAETMASLAEEIDVLFVDQARLFEEIVKSRPWADLLSPDGGHVNGEAYGMMARHLVEALEPRGLLGPGIPRER